MFQRSYIHYLHYFICSNPSEVRAEIIIPTLPMKKLHLRAIMQLQITKVVSDKANTWTPTIRTPTLEFFSILQKWTLSLEIKLWDCYDLFQNTPGGKLLRREKMKQIWENIDYCCGHMTTIWNYIVLFSIFMYIRNFHNQKLFKSQKASIKKAFTALKFFINSSVG